MKKKALFICGTPFHVITSILLCNQLNIESDIIIYDAFPDITKLINNLNDEKIFDRIRVLSREKDCKLPKNIFSRYLYAFFGYFLIKKNVPVIIPEIAGYTDVFFANNQRVDINDRFIYCYIKKYLPDTSIHYMDDGLGAYNECYYNPTLLDYLAKRIILRKKAYINNSDVFLYSPQMFRLVNHESNRIIHEIRKPSAEIKKILIRVFDYVSTYNLCSDVIIFDTVREEEFDVGGNQVFNQIILKLVNGRKAIVKSHPREKNRYFDLEYFESYGVPFEILCLYNDFSDCTFISCFSTAVFTPKLLFDQEPRVIFLNDYMKKYLVDKWIDRDEYIRILQNLYLDKSKIEVL